MKPVVYLAVHGGAGNHNPKNEKSTKNGLRQACAKAISSAHEAPLSLVEDAISALEDDSRFNAGYGSNLTFDGNVECDASIMDGTTGGYGSVGAVSGVKNPICLARCVLEHARLSDKLGRLPPMTLVSDGAKKFATTNGYSITTVASGELITPRARDEWKYWKARMESSPEPNENRDNQMSGLYDIQDTVGAVVWVEGGNTAAGVSSGGLLLKHSGRVGEAAVYGAGCWAQAGMACSVSGAGEHIVRANLARHVGEGVLASGDHHDVLYRSLSDTFWSSCIAQGELEPNAGLILLTKDDDSDSVRLWCAFTTPSMGIAYASTINPVPKAVILRRPRDMDGLSEGKPRIFITAVTL